MTLKNIWEEIVKPFDTKLSGQDFQALLECGEIFGRKIFASDYILRAVDNGWTIRFWHEFEITEGKMVMKTMWEAGREEIYLQAVVAKTTPEAIADMIQEIANAERGVKAN